MRPFVLCKPKHCSPHLRHDPVFGLNRMRRKYAQRITAFDIVWRVGRGGAKGPAVDLRKRVEIIVSAFINATKLD